MECYTNMSPIRCSIVEEFYSPGSDEVDGMLYKHVSYTVVHIVYVITLQYHIHVIVVRG